MDIEDLKQRLSNTVDEWFSKQPQQTGAAPGISNKETPTTERGAPLTGDLEPTDPIQPPRDLPKDKRVVRTKTSGDRVFLLDEVKKKRQWITNPQVLEASGFTLEDVQEIEESELLKYQMGPALYQVNG